MLIKINSALFNMMLSLFNLMTYYYTDLIFPMWVSGVCAGFAVAIFIDIIISNDKKE